MAPVIRRFVHSYSYLRSIIWGLVRAIKLNGRLGGVKLTKGSGSATLSPVSRVSSLVDRPHSFPGDVGIHLGRLQRFVS